MKRGIKLPVLYSTALVLTLLFVGHLCTKHQGGDPTMKQESGVPPGTLAGITYSHSSGMEARGDFFIILSPDAIVETAYWPEDDAETVKDENGYHQTTKENVPITVAQWTTVEQIVLELYPLMKPQPERRHEFKLFPWMEVRDGSSASSLTLTWDTEDGIRKIKYDLPNDHRVHTLTTLLKELADPRNRDLLSDDEENISHTAGFAATGRTIDRGCCKWKVKKF